MKKTLFYLIIILPVFTGCSRYGYVNLKYPQEPQVYLPEDVQSIAIINRSLTKEEDKSNKVMESIASAEVAGSDKMASDACLNGVFEGMQGSGRATIIYPKESRIYGTGTREIPKLLDWEQVEEICRSSETDVLLVLEMFDSNTDLAFSVAADQAISVITTGKATASVPGQIRMNLECYFRIYDPASRTVIDQYRHSSNHVFNTEDIIPPLGALNETARFAGREYIERFLPSYYTVRRDLYKRAKGPNKHKFKTAFRYAEVANWEGAIEKWNELSNDEKRKTAGRACLNIAVAYEVLGDTDKALEWTKKSYEDYNDKLGRDYAKILLRRQRIEN